MGPDIVSLAHAILSLLKLLYKIRHAGEERNFLLKTLEDTTLLHNRVNSNFRSLGYRISKDEREWINSILTHSELALTEAREVISDAGSKHKKLRRPFRSLRWVLEGKEVATMRMGENLQHHLALMMINFRLFMERRRYVHTCTLGGSTRPCRYPEVPQEFVSLLGSEYLGKLPGPPTFGHVFIMNRWTPFPHRY
jgi:hypothetical protein